MDVSGDSHPVQNCEAGVASCKMDDGEERKVTFALTEGACLAIINNNDKIIDNYIDNNGKEETPFPIVWTNAGKP
ncbi:hypothetical protein [Cohnella nanjingensis]|uniref:hypothetical protein n=1 Tax=Cohnella nanjingensis TaxID=1387779 RepID=UPI001C8802FC|nr:hypothetical protein [Cohnella nanjingensis]